MKLLTEEIRNRLLANANLDNPKPVVKLFTPDAAATWLLARIDPEEPDMAFGLCDLGVGFPELGYVYLPELAELRGRLGLPVERDLYFTPDKPLLAYAEEAYQRGRIVA